MSYRYDPITDTLVDAPRDIEVINLDIAAAHIRQLGWLHVATFLPLIVLGVCGFIAFANQAVENWTDTIASHQEQ